MNTQWVTQLVRENIRKMTPYQSARKLGGEGTVLLNANELPNTIANTRLNRYPDPQPAGIISKYAEYAGVDEKSMLVTRGADEGIELIIRTFCEPEKSEILTLTPTYGMYAINANAQNVGICSVPLLSDRFELNLDEIKRCLANRPISVLFICNPNNPTATSVSLESIQKVVEIASERAIVVIDEAYIEFSTQSSAIELLKTQPHVIILRTLSKAFGLAGARCGFILSNRDITQNIAKIIAPYPIPQPVVDAVIPYLSKDNILKMQGNVKTIQALKETVVNALNTMSIVKSVAPSQTNYLFVTFKQEVFKPLWDKGVVLRDQSFHKGFENSIRITIGDEKENETLINALLSIEASSV